MSELECFLELSGHSSQELDDEMAGDLDDLKCRDIQKHVSSFLQDQGQNDKTLNLVESALSQKTRLTDEEKHDLLTKVETQRENFREVLCYADFLLESIHRKKASLRFESS